MTLAIEPGEFVAIVGPSGAGKSTLLNILGLLDSPTAGTYRLGGVDTSTLTSAERDRARLGWFGFVFQSSFVLGDRTTAWNIALPLLTAGTPAEPMRGRVRALAEQVGLLDRVNADARQLSGGERQRVAIARALANRARILLADEPSGNLDSTNTDRLLVMLEELNSVGQTVVLITHDPAVAARAHRQVMILDGTVVDDRPGNRQAPPQDATAKPIPGRPSSWTRVKNTVNDVVDGIVARAGQSLLLVTAFLLGASAIVTGIGLSQTAAVQVSERLAVAALDEVRVHGGAELTANRTDIEELPHVLGTGISIDVTLRDHPVSQLPANVETTEKIDALIKGSTRATSRPAT